MMDYIPSARYSGQWFAVVTIEGSNEPHWVKHCFTRWGAERLAKRQAEHFKQAARTT